MIKKETPYKSKLDFFKKPPLFPMQLQFFAAGQDEEEDNEKDDEQDDEEEKEDEEKKEKPKTFTQDQMEKIIKQRVARAEKDKEKAIEEAEKLAKMNADEKKEYEFEKLKRENEELKAAQNKYSLGKEAAKMLAESSIAADDEILDFVVREDAEKTKEAVSSFTALVNRVSDERMREKLKGKPPKKNNQLTGEKNPFSKEHFNLTEQGKLLKDNPELYKQLKAQAN